MGAAGTTYLTMISRTSTASMALKISSFSSWVDSQREVGMSISLKELK